MLLLITLSSPLFNHSQKLSRPTLTSAHLNHAATIPCRRPLPSLLLPLLPKADDYSSALSRRKPKYKPSPNLLLFCSSCSSNFLQLVSGFVCYLQNPIQLKKLSRVSACLSTLNYKSQKPKLKPKATLRTLILEPTRGVQTQLGSLKESRYISTASTLEFKKTCNATVELHGQSPDPIMRSSGISSIIS
ncbi:hypothetical protein M9H77_27993 [Catharanthus roseus]|uniref:Uncharacterized protein n=1 Tax=Catharanthus roseus TaxID=4058 RepID=A0ACC0AEA7_CATRO|nr:hypothetical protein M9H77_27993 [Catharanthus roseus]